MTTVTIDITGFELTLANATDVNNQFQLVRDPSFVALDPQGYLQTLVTRQLEGMGEGLERIKADQEVEAERQQLARARFAQAVARKGVLGA